MITNIKETISAINQKFLELSKLSNEELQNLFFSLRQSLKDEDDLNTLLVDVFAIVKETMRRFKDGIIPNGNIWNVLNEPFTWNMVPYDEQLQGGIELHNGKILQMATGEGKTLVAVAPVVLNAMKGKGVHIMTVNDYLSKRDYEITKPVYSFLGFTVGCIETTPVKDESRKRMYEYDITFGTTSSFVFDYLYDNIVTDKNECVQRNFNFAIVDEADSILIDEAQTPHIIGCKLSYNKDVSSYDMYLSVVKAFIEAGKKTNNLYVTNRIKKYAEITDAGWKWIGETTGEVYLSDTNFLTYKSDYTKNVIQQLFTALTVYEKNKDYMVEEKNIVIIDPNTGRPKPSHRWENGLHEAVMAKEHIRVEYKYSQRSAVIAIKNYMLMYFKIAGMTGTAIAAKDEFKEVYGIEVASIPSHKELKRIDNPLRVYKTSKQKLSALILEIKELHALGRPILVGTSSITESDNIAKLIENDGYKVNLLNAKSLLKEAYLISKAGESCSITVATSVAGRGTDIKPSQEALDAGGLAIIGYGIGHSKRIDEQLQGRAGRQGDPGSSVFFVSLEDDIITYLSDDDKRKLNSLAEDAGPDGQIKSHEAEELVLKAQNNEEYEDRKNRKQITERDDMINIYRHKVYELRHALLFNSSNLWPIIADNFPILDRTNNQMFLKCHNRKKTELITLEDSKFYKEYNMHIESILSIALPIMSKAMIHIYSIAQNELIPLAYDKHIYTIKCNYEKVLATNGDLLKNEITRQILISLIDKYWIQFLNKINICNISSYRIKYFFIKGYYKIIDELPKTLLKSSIPLTLINGLQFDIHKYSCTLPSASSVEKAKEMSLCPCGSGLAYCLCHGRNRHKNY